MANNNWNNYTEKTATPVDADEVMVRDSTDGKNKKLLFGTFWKWVAKKLNEATISELQTSNKTIVGALNQLNSDTELITREITISDSNKKIYDLDIDANKYMVISLQLIDRTGWSYIPIRGISGSEKPNNWAVAFIDKPSGTYTFLIAIMKR